MPSFCAAFGCSNRKGRDEKRFFRIPAIRKKCHNVEINKLLQERRESWIRALKREDLTIADEKKINHARICSDHFVKGQPADLLDRSNPDWIPSLKLYGKKIYISPTKANAKMARYERSKNIALKRLRDVEKNKRKQKVVFEIEDSTDGTPSVEIEDSSDGTPVNEMQSEEPAIKEIGCQTEVKQADFSCQAEEHYSDIYQDNISLREEVYRLRDALSKSVIDKESFVNDPTRVLFYTGLTDSAMLLLIFETVEPYITVNAVSNLNKFQQFILTLMKLRLNLLFKDLGYRFNVSNQTASRVFYKVLKILKCRLQNAIVWPEREELKKSMPFSFQECFGKKVTVIIDCFEIFIERPSNFEAAAACWSNYKHHHTLKVLIGICPQGAVTFISPCYGGRASDQFIVEDSTFTEHLLPGDLVMADRGFTIYDLVQLCKAELRIPSFTKGKKQLHPLDVEGTRKIAHVRIHVERVIGALRQKYTILGSQLPISALQAESDENYCLDSIVTVCSALLNFCPPVVTE